MTKLSTTEGHRPRKTLILDSKNLWWSLCQALQDFRSGLWVHITADISDLERYETLISFFCPHIKVVTFPSWGAEPFELVSPIPEYIWARLRALYTLRHAQNKAILLVTTPEALLQKIPSFLWKDNADIAYRTGDQISRSELSTQLENLGFVRRDVVELPGDYAFRGGIVDLYPITEKTPLRLDFFDDELEAIHPFDPQTQRRLSDPRKTVTLGYAREFLPTPSKIKCALDAVKDLRESTAWQNFLEQLNLGTHISGMEQWMPLFEKDMLALPHILSPQHITLGDRGNACINAFDKRIAQNYTLYQETRLQNASDTPPPALTPEHLYVSSKTCLEWIELKRLPLKPSGDIYRLRLGPRHHETLEESCRYLQDRTQDKPVILTGRNAQTVWPQLLSDTDLKAEAVSTFNPKATKQLKVASLPLTQSLETPACCLVALDDFLTNRERTHLAPSQRSVPDSNQPFQFDVGDYVVHEDQGIGRYQGLESLSVEGIVHDCLRLEYAKGDSLFVPVENIAQVTKYGITSGDITLDRLGSTHWHTRKKKAQKKIAAIATYLFENEAKRSLARTKALSSSGSDAYEAFCQKFSHIETADQLRAIEEVTNDLSKARPMDRLICGDVGFGKTEVALRAAFLNAEAGHQTAIIVPTTLLARQHFYTFSKRFEGSGFRIAQLSRMTGHKEAKQIKDDLKSGRIQIVIGTHALLSPHVAFQDLGLLIVDEEQHFGVKQKEHLKALGEKVHVLTLSATPIPRTLQMALGGLRDVSIISTAPLDRLAIKTQIIAWNPAVIRRILLEEKARDGQSFVVCPRISDITKLAPQLEKCISELSVITAHGQIEPEALTQKMIAFEEGNGDVLLSTNIIESGIDISRANTMIIYRPDLFGLGALYQLRGRIGRSTIQAHAYLALPPHQGVSPSVERRLEVLCTLDYLGSGFSLATYDMERRGSGNIAGEAQSGQVQEIGVEYYQKLLAEAIDEERRKRHNDQVSGQEAHTTPLSHPNVQIPRSVSLPSHYIEEASLRVSLYRRIGTISTLNELRAFEAELVDRFGPLPSEAASLMWVIKAKILAQAAWVSDVDVGPAGIKMRFFQNNCPYAEALFTFLNTSPYLVQIKSEDQSLILKTGGLEEGLLLAERFLRDLSTLCSEGNSRTTK